MAIDIRVVPILSSSTLENADYYFDDAVNSALGNPEKWSYDFFSQPQGSLVLFKNGCRPNDESQSQPNCSIACSDPLNIWTNFQDSVYTMQNCMVYPVITRLMQENKLSWDALGNASSMGVIPGAGLPVSPSSWSSISSCISEYCNADGDCSGGTNFDTGIYTNNFFLGNMTSSGNGNLSLGFTSTICDGIKGSINTDIGGPGVFVAYIIQLVTTILLWLVLHVIYTFRPFFLRLVRDRRDWPDTSLLLAVNGRPEKEDEKEIKPRDSGFQISTLFNAAEDFLNTQIFFLVSIEIAILVLTTHSSEFRAPNLQVVGGDFAMVLNLALDGCLSVLFTLITLRAMNHRVHGYLVYATAACVFISGAAWIVSYYGTLDVTDALQSDTLFPSCGGKYSPQEHCAENYNPWWTKNSTAKGGRAIAILVFTWFVTLVLLLDDTRIFRNRSANPKRDGTADDRSTRTNVYALFESFMMKRKFRRTELNPEVIQLWLRRIAAFSIFAMGCVLLSLICVLLDDFLRVRNKEGRQSNAIDWGSWTLSSVISVTVWLPVFARYFYNAIYGILKKRKQKKSTHNTRELHFLNSHGDPESLGP